MGCLHRHGTVECLLLRAESIEIDAPPILVHMVAVGCYAMHIKEMLKFLPKVIYLQAMCI